ncbi:hypothetical protein BH09MYX1_BH09MYX1_60020 [soil metagenome]
MRGYLEPAKRATPSDAQKRFATLSRGRRVKLAVQAKTTLLKADQWAQAKGAPEGIGEALEKALSALGVKKK